MCVFTLPPNINNKKFLMDRKISYGIIKIHVFELKPSLLSSFKVQI